MCQQLADVPGFRDLPTALGAMAEGDASAGAGLDGIATALESLAVGAGELAVPIQEVAAALDTVSTQGLTPEALDGLAEALDELDVVGESVCGYPVG